MNKLVVAVVMMLAALMVGSISCVSGRYDLTSGEEAETAESRAFDELRAAMGHQQQQQPYHQARSKRRLQDVEKLMIEDEILSYLICDVCEKHKCDPNYCRFCTQCIFKFNGELSFTQTNKIPH